MLKGKQALVTGSTSGIGLGIARALAAKGANLTINGFGDAGEIEKLRVSLASEFGIDVVYVNADLMKPAEVESLIRGIEARAGAVDILVNNAGIQHTAKVSEFPVERWDAIIALNLSAAFHAIRCALPAMEKRGWGRIINIASAHGLVASPMKSAYVAAKHGLVGLTKTVALEQARTRITCNAVCPGWVLTPLVQKQIEEKARDKKIKVKDAEHDLLAEKQPSEQFVTPEQIGKLVLFLCSSGADQITGSSQSIDGGWTAQ